MPMQAVARQMTEAMGWRRPYLIAVAISWFVVDAFDGLFVPEETPEHWLEAGFWAAATLVYLVLAWRRPLPAAQRLADWAIASGMSVIGVTLVLRATLPDDAAFRWSMVVAAVYSVVALLGARRHRARTELSSNG
jgi:hypothetical protein